MAIVNVNIQPEIIRWALSQVKEEKLGEKMVGNIAQWLNGTKTPTFNQIEDFSKKANIPLGYFFLKTPPTEKLDLLEFRTIDSVQLANPSRNLIETIHAMEEIQDWMRDYKQEMGFDVLPLVGSMSNVTDSIKIVERIRKDLEISKRWYEQCRDTREAFNYIRRKLEESGIVVMMNGVVGNNTHRALDVNEFRAFAMVDEWAPLIFINSADSNGAKLFSLMHEIVHVWIGEDDLFNDRYRNTAKVRKTEVICNAVASELLVPTKIFLEKWDSSNTDADALEIISELKYSFRCGEVVIARKALDCGKISKEVYELVVKKAIENYNNIKQNREHSGGDYYRTMGSRLDGGFVRALSESVNMGRTSYTEAYRLTNTSRKTYSDVVKGLGGVE